MDALKNSFQEIKRYPGAMVGLALILILIIVGVVVVFAIPYDEAVRLWRGGEDVWYKNPKSVPPAWTNLFTKEDKPPSMNFTVADDNMTKIREENPENGTVDIFYTLDIDYDYDAFPQEIVLFFDGIYEEKEPFADLYWVMPDDTEIRIASQGIDKAVSLYFSQESKLVRRLGGVNPMIGLFAIPNTDPPQVMKGSYQLRIEGIGFEPNSDIQTEFVLYGLVHGVAGTDHLRRDLSIALLWGIPVALSFGLVAAVGTTVLTMVFAAMGVWFGGWVDEVIQRLTEINLVLPYLSILVMIGTFYSKSIWVLLGATVLLGIFGGGIKTYRANFLQIKESMYVEAAQAYGAKSSRIIFRYLIPRIIPLLIPGLVTSIPSFVFLEAGLAVLGLGDPTLPTWGKIINDARQEGALYRGLYYWILQPAGLLFITSLAFAMLGYSLDRIFNPRLRGL
ncbi:MAG: ABC transporter permease [Anaerolineales bacterium]